MKAVIQTAAETHLYGMNILTSFHYPFISVPLLDSFVHFLLIFKLFDVLVCILGQSTPTMLLATHEKTRYISFSSHQKYCLFVVFFVIK